MNRALIVVDMQVGFVSEKSAPIVPKVVDLVERWEATSRDVVFTRFINRPGSPFEQFMSWKKLETSPEIDIVPELAEHAARAVAVIDKPAYGAFIPQFVDLVAARGWTEFVICGIATESCVAQTAVEAFTAGYRPLVVTDACYSHAGQVPHEAGLLSIKRNVGRNQLITSEGVFELGNVAA